MDLSRHRIAEFGFFELRKAIEKHQPHDLDRLLDKLCPGDLASAPPSLLNLAIAEKVDLRQIRRILALGFPRRFTREHFSQAISQCDAELLRLLIDEGGDPNVKDGFNHPPLIALALRAVWPDDTAPTEWAVLLQCLLDAGADLDGLTNNRTTTPLIAAARSPTSIGMLRRLILAGADPEKTGVQGQSPLHTAAHNHNSPAVRILLEAGVNPDPVDSQGWTPLTLYVSSRSRIVLRIPNPEFRRREMAVLRELIAGGADLNRPGSNGIVPRDILRERLSAQEFLELIA